MDGRTFQRPVNNAAVLVRLGNSSRISDDEELCPMAEVKVRFEEMLLRREGAAPLPTSRHCAGVRRHRRRRCGGVSVKIARPTRPRLLLEMDGAGAHPCGRRALIQALAPASPAGSA